MWISYLVPQIVKSCSESPILAVFVENVEVLPGTANKIFNSHNKPLGQEKLCLIARLITILEPMTTYPYPVLIMKENPAY